MAYEENFLVLTFKNILQSKGTLTSIGTKYQSGQIKETHPTIYEVALIWTYS